MPAKSEGKESDGWPCQRGNKWCTAAVRNCVSVCTSVAVLPLHAVFHVTRMLLVGLPCYEVFSRCTVIPTIGNARHSTDSFACDVGLMAVVWLLSRWGSCCDQCESGCLCLGISCCRLAYIHHPGNKGVMFAGTLKRYARVDVTHRRNSGNCACGLMCGAGRWSLCRHCCTMTATQGTLPTQGQLPGHMWATLCQHQ